ncbi:IS3 family transposase [Exiguobacterium artemiae]|uniref:IS3 family transposase n=1 Tax=Exiguobacterium artemiae TaxID=340145 RepID=UPI003D079DA2
MSKSKFSPDEKLRIIKMCEDRMDSIKSIASLFELSVTTLNRWRAKYRTYGSSSLRDRTEWTGYPEELKMEAVRAVLTQEESLTSATVRFNISSLSVLARWIRKYTSHNTQGKPLKERSIMTKGRTTTFEERVQAVMDCIQNGKDYQNIMKTHRVSYQQIYSWVRKFEKDGMDALTDRRGRQKPVAELTDTERFALELKRLEKENERLRMEKRFPKKVRGDREEVTLSQIRLQDKYEAIQSSVEQFGYPIIALCHLADVSRAAYYKWLRRIGIPKAHEAENMKIIEEMNQIHLSVKGIYGYRRMKLNLKRRFGRNVNAKRVRRLMHIASIHCVIRRKRPLYIRNRPQQIAENILNRDFNAAGPNQKWVTDVTELKYGASQKAYLSAILDLYDGSIRAFVLGHSNNNQLVFDTFELALQGASGSRPLLHSDRGFQYTSHAFRHMTRVAGITQSMSRVGKCIDNGPMESFWGALKCESYYLHKFAEFDELQLAIQKYIHFYNEERYQQRLNGLAPLEYRAQAV